MDTPEPKRDAVKPPGDLAQSLRATTVCKWDSGNTRPNSLVKYYTLPAMSLYSIDRDRRRHDATSNRISI